MKSFKTLRFYLPILTIIVGALFVLFIFHEYQRNIGLIDENRALIASSAKARLKANLMKAFPDGSNEDEIQDYNWVSQKPNYYYFKQGKQLYPWPRKAQVNALDSVHNWKNIWSEVNSLKENKYVDPERLQLLFLVRDSLYLNDKEKIVQSFDKYMQHVEASVLSPLEEIAFSLKLIELGLHDHWNSALVEAFLLNGGPKQKPIIRPVIDWVFKFNQLLSVNEFNQIIQKIQLSLEQANLPNYFLDDYLLHFFESQFQLLEDESYALEVRDNSWLLKRQHDGVYAINFNFETELNHVKKQFVELGSLQETDTLFFLDDVSGEFDQLRVLINKKKLNQTEFIQHAFLFVKVLILCAFVLLLLLTLKMIRSNQARRLEYINLKEDFVKLVGHELKTPLSGIRAMAETMQKRSEKGLEVQFYPQRIISESDKLWYMVDNILSFNRVQESNFSLKLEKVSLHELCHSVASDVVHYSDKQYDYSNEISTQAYVLVDVELFKLVVKNILVNAALYNDKDRVSVVLFMQNNVLKIQDNGIGIDSNNFKKVFEPFVRLPQLVRSSGSGIGLALCQKVMQLHGGNISIERSDHSGTVWVISINDGK